nr:hypothetical protein [Tanacetum cinerariifolium]
MTEDRLLPLPKMIRKRLKNRAPEGDDVKDDTIDDVLDMGNEGVEPSGNTRAFDVVEDDQENRDRGRYELEMEEDDEIDALLHRTEGRICGL